MIELPKSLLKEKLPHEMCCNIALHWHETAQNSQKSGLVNACGNLGILLYLGHSDLVVLLLVSELVRWL